MTVNVYSICEDGFFHRMFFARPAGSDSAVDTDDTYLWLWWFCLAWFVFLMFLMVFWVIKYRRRPGKIAPVSSSHNTPLEVAWTVIPTLCLVYIFFRGFWGYMDKVIAPGEAIEMSLTGQKWNWTLVYPNGAESTALAQVGAKERPVFYMPANTPIRLRMNSVDVMHAFWVPDFRMKQDLLPNRYTTQWFKARPPAGGKTLPTSESEAKARKMDWIPDIAGAPYEDHWVFCAEYCGDEHSEMAALIRVVPDDAFKKWLEATATGVGKSELEIGQIMYRTKCSSCHSVDGSRGTGPTWKDMFGHDVKLKDGRTVKVDENYVRKSILEPGSDIVEGFANAMPIVELKEKQIGAIITYMKSISDAGGVAKPADAAPADAKPSEAKPAAGQPAATGGGDSKK